MRVYFRTDSGYGFTDDAPEEIPESWTVITQEEYDAHEAAEAQAQADAEAAVLAAANTRWTTVHDDMIRIGSSDEAAVLLANAVGIRPAE